jgi:hypothetical protein
MFKSPQMSKWNYKEDWKDYDQEQSSRVGRLLFCGLVISVIIALCKLVEWLVKTYLT